MLALLLSCAGPLPASQTLTPPATACLWGEEGGGYAGLSVALAGDMNGDGLADALIGAPYAGEGGVVWLLHGEPGLSGLRTPDEVGAVLLGADEEAAGFSVDGAGDVDGDGWPDLIIGGWARDGTGTDAGGAWLIYGPISGARALATAGEVFEGPAAYDVAGFAVAGGGDVDGDGRAEVLVGAPFSDPAGSRSGSAWLLGAETERLDAARATFTGARPGDHAGHAVSFAGDIDGDGLGDVLIGAWEALEAGERPGAALLWLGPVSGTLSALTADLRLIGEASGDHAGHSLAGPGDVDGDGRDDLLIGDSEDTGRGTRAGKVYFVSGAGL